MNRKCQRVKRKEFTSQDRSDRFLYLYSSEGVGNSSSTFNLVKAFSNTRSGKPGTAGCWRLTCRGIENPSEPDDSDCTLGFRRPGGDWRARVVQEEEEAASELAEEVL